jgi:D-alanyl-lipoteichoic acid acyltransferase DltB (MBOAT superfamily)
MLFHSLPYVVFLAAVFAVAALLERWRGARLWFLLCASLGFYAAWNPAPVLLLLLLSTVSWGVGRALASVQHPAARRAWLVAGVAHAVAVLGLFKYGDWLGRSACEAAGLAGIPLAWRPLGLLLPVGLSFVSFQCISYVVDVYRGELPARGSWRDVTLYVSFFPHVVAGPIVRASDFLPQLDVAPRVSDEEGARALLRIGVGMVKKLAVADLLGAQLVDRVFASPANHSGPEVIVGIVGYTLQLYCDFSAYSDVAIGSAALFGIRFRENFDFPYRAEDLFDFWRRWHASLGTWLRDHVYRPLGGGRGGGARALRNLWITLLLGGLWHGAHVKFLAWSAVHAGAMSLQRLAGWPWAGASRSARVLGWAVTFAVVVQSRVLFRAADVGAAWEVFRRQFHVGGHSPHLGGLTWLLLAAAAAGHLVPRRWHERPAQLFAAAPVPVRVGVLVGMALGVRAVASVNPQPFIYFQF